MYTLYKYGVPQLFRGIGDLYAASMYICIHTYITYIMFPYVGVRPMSAMVRNHMDKGEE